MPTHDIVIRGGSVIDGTGADPITADVAISGGVITSVGDVSGAAVQEIDADGALVTPGFVDVHTHYDGQATWDERMQPSSWHGVTTVVMGNCGVGFAPVHEHHHSKLIELMEGVEDIPGVALHEGLSWEWSSFPEFMDNVDRRPHDIDIAAQFPHAALRLHVMGERGANREPATAEEIAEMGRLAAEGIEAGALGFTTSRTLNHKTSTGDPTPTLTAAREELVGIAEAIGATGKGVLQMVGDFIDIDTEFETLRQMVARSGRPLSFSLVEAPMAPQQCLQLIERMEKANADGLEIRAQVAPRAVGLLLGLDCTLNPFMTNPVFRELGDTPASEKARRLRDPEFRQRVLESHEKAKESGKLGGGVIQLWSRMFPMTDPPNYEPTDADSVAGIAAATGRSPEDVALDHLLSDDGNAYFYVPFLNYGRGNLDACEMLLGHEFTVPGLGDGGAHVGTICDASFPTFLLTHWGRDRDHGRFPLSYLVQQHTRDTARLVGLHDRGVLAPGYRADVNVIDFANLSTPRPHMRHDLPAGGRRVLQGATGYLHTIVAGQETYRNGEATDALPGRLVRGGQPTPA